MQARVSLELPWNNDCVQKTKSNSLHQIEVLYEYPKIAKELSDEGRNKQGQDRSSFIKNENSLLAFRWLENYFNSLWGKGHNQILAASVTCIFSLKKPNSLI